MPRINITKTADATSNIAYNINRKHRQLMDDSLGKGTNKVNGMAAISFQANYNKMATDLNNISYFNLQHHKRNQLVLHS